MVPDWVFAEIEKYLTILVEIETLTAMLNTNLAQKLVSVDLITQIQKDIDLANKRLSDQQEVVK